MHSAQREKVILDLLRQNGFVSFRDLDRQLDASQATLRRDLVRLAKEGQIARVRGGAKLLDPEEAGAKAVSDHLSGVPFHENIKKMRLEKQAIGKTAAGLCEQGSAVMIDGGSTTLQMCQHLQGKGLQVLTNSLHIVAALLPQSDARVHVPGGTVFQEQNIILSVANDDLMPSIHAPQLFLGAAAVGKRGIMQADHILVEAERRLIDRAEEVILLVDHSKFRSSTGNVVTDLSQIDKVVTDDGIDQAHIDMLETAGVELIIATAD